MDCSESTYASISTVPHCQKKKKKKKRIPRTRDESYIGTHELRGVFLGEKQKIPEELKPHRVFEGFVDVMQRLRAQTVTGAHVPNVQERDLEKEVWEVVRQSGRQGRSPGTESARVQSRFCEEQEHVRLEKCVPVVSYTDNLGDALILQHLHDILGHRLELVCLNIERFRRVAKAKEIGGDDAISFLREVRHLMAPVI